MSDSAAFNKYPQLFIMSGHDKKAEINILIIV